MNGAAPAPMAAPPVPKAPLEVAVVRRKARKWLLSVCVSQYQDARFGQLSGVVSDVMLVVLELALWGFQCTTLFDKEATSAAIRQKLAELACKVKPGDEVVLHCLGHGGRNKHAHPAAAEKPAGMPEEVWVDTFLPYDAVFDDGLHDIPLLELHRWTQYLWELGAGVTYLADHCHSTTSHAEGLPAGRGKQAFCPKPRLLPVWPSAASEFCAPALAGVRVLLAGEWALEWQRSGEAATDRRGHFSSLLVDALRAARVRLEAGVAPVEIGWDALIADLSTRVAQSEVPKPSPILARVPAGLVLPALDATTTAAAQAARVDPSRLERGAAGLVGVVPTTDSLSPGHPFQRPTGQLPGAAAVQPPPDAEAMADALASADAHEAILQYQPHGPVVATAASCDHVFRASALCRSDRAACSVLGLPPDSVPVLREEDAPKGLVEVLKLAGERDYSLVDREACLLEVQRRAVESEQKRKQQEAEAAVRRRQLQEEYSGQHQPEPKRMRVAPPVTAPVPVPAPTAVPVPNQSLALAPVALAPAPASSSVSVTQMVN